MENVLTVCYYGVFVLNRLKAAGQHERAAAVALFNNKLLEAIKILSSQKANQNLGAKGGCWVTTALSWFKKTTFV